MNPQMDRIAVEELDEWNKQMDAILAELDELSKLIETVDNSQVSLDPPMQPDPIPSTVQKGYRCSIL